MFQSELPEPQFSKEGKHIFMTKDDLIQLIANAGVPEGATLIQRDIPNGLTIAKVGQGGGGIAIAIARMFAAKLHDLTHDLPETPTPGLFERLHVAAIEVRMEVLETLTSPHLMDREIAEHWKAIQLLRKAATDLCITYTEPEDPLLK